MSNPRWRVPAPLKPALGGGAVGCSVGPGLVIQSGRSIAAIIVGGCKRQPHSAWKVKL